MNQGFLPIPPNADLYFRADGTWAPLEELKIKPGPSGPFLRGDGTWVNLSEVVAIEDIAQIYDYDS